MNMLTAIALSSSNKAKTTNNEGDTIIVEERYNAAHEWWFHVWQLKTDENNNEYAYVETDIPLVKNVFPGLKKFFNVNPEDQIWSRV